MVNIQGRSREFKGFSAPVRALPSTEAIPEYVVEYVDLRETRHISGFSVLKKEPVRKPRRDNDGQIEQRACMESTADAGVSREKDSSLPVTSIRCGDSSVTASVDNACTDEVRTVCAGGVSAGSRIALCLNLGLVHNTLPVGGNPTSAAGGEEIDGMSRIHRMEPGELPQSSTSGKLKSMYSEDIKVPIEPAGSSGGKPFYRCPMCFKTFTLMSSLTRHRKAHTGERPHVCKECGRAFFRHYDLRNHERTHSGEKPYPCPHCDKRFGRHSDLSRHVTLNHGPSPELHPRPTDPELMSHPLSSEPMPYLLP